MLIVEDKEISVEGCVLNAQTLEVFAEVKAGNLKKFNSVEALFEDLNADDELPPLGLT